MKTILNLLQQAGLLAAFQTSEEFHLKVENPPYMPLVVERLGSLISVAHYGEQNGDLMRDPEITFDLDWQPLSFQNDYAGTYEQFTETTSLAQRRRNAVRSFVLETWDPNLHAQQFDDLTRVKLSSLSHGHLLKGESL